MRPSHVSSPARRTYDAPGSMREPSRSPPPKGTDLTKARARIWPSRAKTGLPEGGRRAGARGTETARSTARRE